MALRCIGRQGRPEELFPREQLNVDGTLIEAWSAVNMA